MLLWPCSILLSLTLVSAAPAPDIEITGLPMTGAAAEDFLRDAKIVTLEEFDTKGITKPRRATLSDGERSLRAVFKDVNKVLPRENNNQGRPIIGLKDTYKHEIAAYELDKLLGLGIVPPCVERKIGQDIGSLCMWVENAMTEWQRNKVEKIPPPDPQSWNDQMFTIRVFHQLVWDTDYNNINNILVDANWKLWKIDLGRAFRSDPKLRRPESLTRFPRTMLAALRTLDRQEVEERLGPWLDKKQIKGLLARRDAIVDRADRLIAKQGEEAVLFDP